MTRGNPCELILAAPGLAGAAPQWFERAGLVPETPQLSRLLARAQRHPSPLTTATSVSALTLFDLVPGEMPPPWAALAQAGDAESVEPGLWLRLDPVHLRPDMAQLLLFTAPDVQLSGDEAHALAQTVAECLTDYGELRVLHPERWYLRLRDETALETVMPEHVVGRDVRDAMPSGAAGRSWRTRINEIQMRLFEHPVNAARETRGEPAINSVWPWGWGHTPAIPAAPYRSVTASAPVVRGLARLGAVAAVGSAGSLADWLALSPGPGRHLVWLAAENPRTAGEPEGWAAWLAGLEAHWFAPLAQALRERRLDGAVLHSGDGNAWRLTSGAVRRFWRRSTPWHTRLQLQGRS